MSGLSATREPPTREPLEPSEALSGHVPTGRYIVYTTGVLTRCN